MAYQRRRLQNSRDTDIETDAPELRRIAIRMTIDDGVEKMKT